MKINIINYQQFISYIITIQTDNTHLRKNQINTTCSTLLIHQVNQFYRRQPPANAEENRKLQRHQVRVSSNLERQVLSRNTTTGMDVLSSGASTRGSSPYHGLGYISLLHITVSSNVRAKNVFCCIYQHCEDFSLRHFSGYEMKRRCQCK